MPERSAIFGSHFAVGLCCLAAAFGQTAPSPALPPNPTLAQAKEYALRNSPRIRSAQSTANAAQSVVKEVRSARLPNLTGLVTGVGAEHASVLSAGALQTSSLSSRFASGISLNQLVTDFGRTNELVKSADLRAQAQSGTAETVRRQVLLQVEQAWFQALGANAVLRAAQAAVRNREVTLRQIRALAASSLRSTLDVQFAEVALSQAQLDLYRTENNVAEAQADLAAALGLDHPQPLELQEQSVAGNLDPDPEPRIQEAMQKRPELAGLKATHEAAQRFAEAERRLKLPTLSLLGVAGVVPVGDPRLSNTYSAAGLNLSIPVLNGGLYSARRAEAEQRLAATESDFRDLTVQVSREVRVAWLQASTSARRLEVTARLEAQANEALRLAQTRYDLGLGSIVELSQAQFSQTSAQIENAGARYEYLSKRSALDYATGVLQ